MRRKSGFGLESKLNELMGFVPFPPGQRYPELCPPHRPQPESMDTLGQPLSIRQAAALIGCSEWTVRQTYLPLGIPHFRVSPTGKLIFYKSQIVRWILSQQQKGGMS